jgi:shikimate O-hydroxycinnamoyltransferase
MPRLMSEDLDRLVLMNDYSKLPFYEVDFGGGTPFWYDMAMGPIPWQVIVAPTPERDGGRDLHLCLPRDKFNPDLLRS